MDATWVMGLSEVRAALYARSDDSPTGWPRILADHAGRPCPRFRTAGTGAGEWPVFRALVRRRSPRHRAARLRLADSRPEPDAECPASADRRVRIAASYRSSGLGSLGNPGG